MTATADVSPYRMKDCEGASIWTLDSWMTFKATGSLTGGSLTLIDDRVSPATHPRRHIHRHEDECVYVLEGEFVFEIGGERFEATRGDFVFMPRLVPHAFAVRSATARCLGLFVPAGIEDVFHALGEPASSPSLPPPNRRLTDEQRREGARRAADLGIEIVGPSLEL